MYNDIRGCPIPIARSDSWQRFPPLAQFAGGCVFNRGLKISAPNTPGIQERKKAHLGIFIRVGF